MPAPLPVNVLAFCPVNLPLLFDNKDCVSRVLSIAAFYPRSPVFSHLTNRLKGEIYSAKKPEGLLISVIFLCICSTHEKTRNAIEILTIELVF